MMKRVLAALAATAVATIGLVAGAAETQAATTTFAQVQSVRLDKNDPTIAYLKTVYRCTTADHTSPHSFVSIKQVGSRKLDLALREEGSSGLAIGSGGAWAMSHRNAINCDGKVHVATFVADQVETSEFGVPVMPFARGWGYTQFCIFDDNYPLPPEGTPDEEGAPYDATSFRFAT